jgi:hypothetical protein
VEVVVLIIVVLCFSPILFNRGRSHFRTPGGPPTLSFSTGFLKRRLFTNLFLPGDALANNLRAVLWMTVPCPELSIILLDWSSLLKGGGNNNNNNFNNPSALSKVALPILTSMLQFNIQPIRQFLFGQILVSSSAPTNHKNSNTDQSWSLLVTKRNDHALRVLEQYLEEQQEQASLSSSSRQHSTALLYGSSHCPDLHSKLQSVGFQPIQTVWRTAWTVQQDGSDSAANSNNLLPGLACLVLAYLTIGALDWVGMMGGVSQAWFEQGDYVDGLLLAGLYLVRHALLYLGLSKFLIDWDTNQ